MSRACSSVTPHVGHRGARVDLLRRADPARHVLGRVGQHAGEVDAAARRPRAAGRPCRAPSATPGIAWQRAAAELAQQQLAALGVAAERGAGALAARSPAGAATAATTTRSGACRDDEQRTRPPRATATSERTRREPAVSQVRELARARRGRRRRDERAPTRATVAIATPATPGHGAGEAARAGERREAVDRGEVHRPDDHAGEIRSGAHHATQPREAVDEQRARRGPAPRCSARRAARCRRSRGARGRACPARCAREREERERRRRRDEEAVERDERHARPRRRRSRWATSARCASRSTTTSARRAAAGRATSADGTRLRRADSARSRPADDRAARGERSAAATAAPGRATAAPRGPDLAARPSTGRGTRTAGSRRATPATSISTTIAHHDCDCGPAHVDRQPDAAADVHRRLRAARGSSSHAQCSERRDRDDAARRRRARTSLTVSSRKNAAVNDRGDERRPARHRHAAARTAACASIGLVTSVSRPPVGASRAGSSGRPPRRFARFGLVPQRLAARDDRDAAVRVVAARQPLERARVPDVAGVVLDATCGSCARRRRGSSSTPAAIMNAPTVDTMLSASQPEPGGVGVDAPRHAGEPGDVHREERDVEADEHQPEHPAPDALRQRVAG